MTSATAHLTSTTVAPLTTVIAVRGDLDATNAHEFVDYALQHPGHALVLDLTGVEFFGTAAFSAIHTLNVRCAGSGVEWVLVPSWAVARLLRVCDPDATLPVAADVDEAVARLHRNGSPLLELVAELGQ
ncbi:STAS domain-containing protein [Mycolicibacterium sp. S2-37]|uniref:STAS domain-containing protein n=1 Tax=Mycolicibacterium sp. S2-37 TaxID=2810297 RepID=UPI001A93E09F|nr:STAS domain-containing protein [Mycolicibacterium sp. S2-37]MBO0677723.1 STAS domain-containing protein [Mycolicibacterium sp. S2-37]